MQELDRFAHGAAGPALRTGLADLAVFLRGLDNAPAFADVVADRLLDIDVLAALQTPDGGQGVPVVGGGDGDDVDGLIVHDAAEVLFEARRLALLLLDMLHGRRDDGAVAIANGGDDAAVFVGEIVHMAHAAPVDTDDGHV